MKTKENGSLLGKVIMHGEAPDFSNVENKKTPHEQWQVLRNLDNKVEDGFRVTTFERVKLLRKSVKISKRDAMILNYGIITHPDNRYFGLYLLPGEELPVVKKKIS